MAVLPTIISDNSVYLIITGNGDEMKLRFLLKFLKLTVFSTYGNASDKEG